MMKKFLWAVPALVCVFLSGAASSAELMVAATMQRCTATEECTLVTNSCTDNCGFIPVNKVNLPVLEQNYAARCNKPSSANVPCTMNPPMAAACINGRCTIDYAYINNGDKNDYKSGAFGVPPAAVPSKIPGDYSKVNDRKGAFSAYDLPQNDVRQDSMGEIKKTIYVPPSAPVSGGNYVSVTKPQQTAPAPAGTPAPAAPVVPAPIAAPTPAPVPRAPDMVQSKPRTPSLIVAPTQAPPVLAPVPNVPAAAVQMPVATPANVPVMKPSRPNQLPPTAAVTPVTPAPTAAPAPLEYVAPAPKTLPAVPPIPAVGATGVPQAPAGSVPIPPSDLKPSPTFIPPAGVAIPVGPNDPGAPPAPGTMIQLKGTDAIVPPATGSQKTFAPKTDKQYMGSAGNQ